MLGAECEATKNEFNAGSCECIENSLSGLEIGVIVALVVFLLAALALVAFVVYKQKKKNKYGM